MTRANIERKTVWFDRNVWQMLNLLMSIYAIASPSLMVERLVKDAHNETNHTKGTENGRTVSTI